MISVSEHRTTSPGITPEQMNLILRSSVVWIHFATWIREYLASIYAGFGNQEAVMQRLNRISTEFGNIFGIVFGVHVTEKYINLISDFIKILESFVTAQINGDANAVNEYTKQLYNNADQSAAFLSQINPYWQENEWKSLLYEFIRLTIQESSTLLDKEYTKNIDVFDKILSHTSEIGDYYSQGLLNYLNLSKK